MFFGERLEDFALPCICVWPQLEVKGRGGRGGNRESKRGTVLGVWSFDSRVQPGLATSKRDGVCKSLDGRIVHRGSGRFSNLL